MTPFRWNHKKNEQLKNQRGISFEQIVLAIEADGLLDVLQHSNREKYPNQRVLVVAVEQYVYLIPYVEEGRVLLSQDRHTKQKGNTRLFEVTVDDPT